MFTNPHKKVLFKHGLMKIKPIVILLPLILSGCATFSSDGGFGAVEKSTQQYIKQKPIWANSEAQQQAAATQLAALLAKPLSVNDAVQIALINNANLQANFYDLQIAEANVVQAGRLPNPIFDMLYAKNNGEFKIEQALTFNVLALFTMPKASAIEKQRFAAVQNKVVLQVLDTARQTRNAYFDALAARESVHYLTQVNDSAEATAEFAKRMQKAGNFSALDKAREQVFYADAALELAQAKNKQVQADEALTRLLGLHERTAFSLPERLPDLPKSNDDLKQVKPEDFAKRLDIAQMRSETEALASQLGLSKATRLVNVLELGPARVLEGKRGEPYKKGVTLSFELPIFDWGQSKVKRAEAVYMQSLQHSANLAVVAASQVRSHYAQYQASYAIAQYYRDDVVPLRKKMLQENLLRYNGMLIGPFDLMADARAQVQSVNSYIAALRDFWVADSNLNMVLVGEPIAMKEGF
jgi:outer membrane protein TolC